MPESAQLRKAAIVLASLPPDEAAKLMAKLRPRQVEAVSIELARLGRLSGQEQQTVLAEFAESNPNQLGGEAGGLDLAKTLLQKALGAKAADALEKVQQSVEAQPFSFLKKVDPQNLQTFVIDEHPQTIALILSHLTPAYGSQLMAVLPPEKQLAVIRRIAYMGQTSPEVIEEVEEALRSRISSLMNQSYRRAGGVEAVAEILNVTDRATERALLENLAGEDPDLVEQIRRLMFVFEDIAKLSDKDVQTVLKNVDTSQWAMALKNASPELKQKILGNMGSRAAQMLQEEMEYLGSVRLSEVERVQQLIVDVVRRLEEAGEITTSSDQEDDTFVT